ncbi:MAG TPA: PHP domain-containing protein [Candidatus Rifleibacterium sp.]|nr:PHP domain-containing protein [Candidatus Rifleibacterium sp.]HPT48123.1 PHP domain-containing protein [Candidatus Rifleibacterium sp.]
MQKKPTVYADLHTHSTASDGMLTPVQLVEKADKIGLKVLGITDHDTVDGIRSAAATAAALGVKLVPGIELSCGWEGRDSSVHVLGLFVDPDAPELVELLETQKKSRFARAHKILSLLTQQGFAMNDLAADFNNSPEKVLGRPHLARFLVEKGYVSDFQEAFDRFLLRGRPAYVPKDHVEPAKGIAIIHAAGGIAVLAHPGLIPDWDRVWSTIEALPWDGIETFYSEHSTRDVRRFRAIVEKRNWIASGGSDYHGDYGKHIDRLGQAGLSLEQFNQMLEKCAARGVHA